MMKRIPFLIMGLFFVISSLAQSVDDYFSRQYTKPFPKLYLHTDREYYFIGDTLWFSPYIVMSCDNHLLSNNCNLYVDLINSKGELVEEKNFLLDKGLCSGYISFDNGIIADGTYTLRAYTDHMKPLGEEAFFRKTIQLNRAVQKKDEEVSDKKEEKVLIDFYPEGGFLLDGYANQMAFTVHDQDGKKINFKGELSDPDQNRIPVETSYTGVGSLMFVPHAGQKYKIEATGYKNIQFRMPEIRRQGAKLMLSGLTDNAAKFYIIASNDMSDDEYYIAIFHRGIGLSYIRVDRKNLLHPIKIISDHLGEGVNRLVLLNGHFEPLSERLIFVNKTSDDYQVRIEPDKKELSTRSRQTMKLSIPKIKNNEEWARLSVSVVNKQMLGYSGNLLDIRSYLLLDSELKGQVSTPGFYFVDDSVSSSRKLDLLMLTSGWRNYIWDYVKEKGDIDYPDTSPGFTFTGKMQRKIANKPLIGTDVFLNIANKDIQEMRSTKTDENGCFRFDSVAFQDTALVLFQGKNYKNKNFSRIELLNDNCEHFPFDVSRYNHPEDIGKLSYEMFHLKYMNEMALKEFFPDRDSRLLEEINVVAEKKEKTDLHFRFYGKANVSKKLTDTDRKYKDIYQYLSGRFAGVQVYGKTISIRGRTSLYGSNDPLFLLDGFPIDSTFLESISMSDIDVVEVLKGPETAIFGMRGANGVISIFTRTGADYESTEREIPGTIIKKLKGFEKFRVFYSPVYDENNINSEIPDYRQTLYWNPAIVIGNETKEFSFFAGDNLAYYKIFVEGITASGKICTGEAGFAVNERK